MPATGQVLVDDGDLVPERRERIADGRVRGDVPFLLVGEQRRHVVGDEDPSKPPPLDVGHVAHEAEQRESARRDRGQAGLRVGEPVEFPGEHRAVVREVPEQHRTLVVGERLGRGEGR